MLRVYSPATAKPPMRQTAGSPEREKEVPAKREPPEGRPAGAGVPRPGATDRPALAFRRQPFPGDRLRPLVGHELSPTLPLLGADRSRILAELRPHRHRLLDGRPLADFCEPALDVRELVDIDLAVRPARCPRIADHVGNRVLAGGEIALVEQTEVHDAVDAVCLVVEPAKGIRKITVASGFGGAAEMALLAELGALIGQLPADPLGDLVFAARVLRPEPPGLLGEIHHDRSGFEDRDRGAPSHRLVVDDRRHPAIGRNLQELGSELVATTDIDRLDRVEKPELLEQDDYLLAVSSRPEI